VNPPSWSLACEVLFYLSFPVVFRLVRRIPASRLWLTAGLLVGLIVSVPLIAQALPGLPVDPSFHIPLLRLWFVYLFPVTRLLEFALGVVIAHLVLDGRWIRIGLLPALALALPCYGLTLVVPVLFSMAATMIVPLALIIGATARADVRNAASPTRGHILVRPGEWSFAFYILHELVLLFGLKILAGSAWSVPAGLAAGALFVVVTLGCAAILYSLVERPAMRYFGRSRPGRAEAPAASFLPASNGLVDVEATR
jgi:peptidoglycan/LPS O-acetylase OafA/YrhL